MVPLIYEHVTLLEHERRVFWGGEIGGKYLVPHYNDFILYRLFTK